MSGIMLSFLAAGGGSPYWINQLSGADFDVFQNLTVDSLGNSYAVGVTYTSSVGSGDFLIVKYSPTGILEWQTRLGSTDIDVANGVGVDSSSNVYVVGQSNGSGISTDMIVAKYNSSGVIQWQRSLSGPTSADDLARKVAVTSAGNLYVVGRSYFSGTVSDDAVIVKYDTSGNVQWQRRLGGGSSKLTNGVAIALDSSENVYISGSTDNAGAGGNDILVAKYNSSGTIQWQRVLGAVDDESASGIAVDTSGNVYISGYTSSQGSGNYDAVIAKYDTSGTIQWQRTLGSSTAQFALNVAVDTSANVYVTGASSDSPGRIFAAKYNTSGTIQWQRFLAFASNPSSGEAITVDALGNMYIAGSFSDECVLFKLPSDGSLTGTYGSWTYSTASMTSSTSSLTAATSTLTAATPTLTSATSTLTSAASSLTPTKISV